MCVSADAFAIMNSGTGTFSNPPVWCSPIQNSEKPSRSASTIAAMSRS